MDFSTVAMTQAKLISHLRTSGAGDRSMTTMDNTTLPWTGSITTETLAPEALAESRWHRQGAKPKSSSPSTSCLRTADPLCFIREDGVEAPVSTTPLRLGEHRSVVHRGAGARRTPPPLPPDLPLDNRFDILSLQDFPPVGAMSGLPTGPAHPAGGGSHKPRIRGPAGSLPSISARTNRVINPNLRLTLCAGC